MRPGIPVFALNFLFLFLEYLNRAIKKSPGGPTEQKCFQMSKTVTFPTAGRETFITRVSPILTTSEVLLCA